MNARRCYDALMNRTLRVLLALLSTAALAQQPDVKVESGRVIFNGRAFEAGCVAMSAVSLGQIHVACADGRVRTFEPGEPDPRFLQERRVEGELRGLFVQGGRVWVEYARVEAQPMGNLAPSTAGLVAMPGVVAPPPMVADGTPPAPTPAAQVTTQFVVLEVSGPDVVVSIGKAQGLRGDQTVEIGEQTPGATTIVGRAREVADGRSVVQVGFGEKIAVGAPVRLSTRAVTGSMAGPPRTGGIISIGGHGRVMLPIGTLGIGGLFDAEATWHAETLFALRARLFPLGGAVLADGRTGGNFGAAVEGLFDSQFFAIGLGVGVEQYMSFVQVFGGFGQTSGFTFGLTQVLRVGALDGISFSARNHLAVVGAAFNFTGLEGALQIPISRTWWLLIRGGGSVAPLAWAELGMRIAVKGNGGPDTLFLTPSLGFAGLNSGTAFGMAFGPTAGIGFEYRAGL